MHCYEKWITRRYLANALRTSRSCKPPRPDADILTWIDAHGRSVGLPEFGLGSESRSWRAGFAEQWKAWRNQAVALARERPPGPSPLQRRLDWLAEACSLSDPQRWFLGLLARIDRVPKVGALVAAVNDRYDLDISVPESLELRRFLEPGDERSEHSTEARLAELGLIADRDDSRLSGVVRKILALRRLGARSVGDLLLGKPAPASLGWDDFAHLGDMRDLAARVVKTSDRSRGRPGGGPNLLLYGPPGTGKTEFAKTLGARLGFSVQFVGETNDENTEPNRRERIAALIIANAIGAVARRAILVVDEADDLFAGVDEDSASARHGSKVFMNRLVERTNAPTIWITNSVAQLGPPVVRRMNLALRFARPGLALRKTIVARIAKGASFPLDGNSALDLARSPAAPALIENAILSAAQIKGSPSDAKTILRSSLCALGLRERSGPAAPIAFDPTLSSADVDLGELAGKAVRSRSRALSFCLSGPPGTGKSAYARYLAERLDMEILEKRYSDLSSMYLGELEKAIAAAFEEAADTRAFLIVDEADSLLRDRWAARHSWEVTQVNEMLTWMERHAHPFACTTNAPELLDAAAARRFLFKVRFLPMTCPQISVAYRRAFGHDAPAHILKLDGLTPGDFATVARKVAALSERDPKLIAKWLEGEALAKPGAGRRKIGFWRE